jgi:putative peptidoglycan lipid II flippase
VPKHANLNEQDIEFARARHARPSSRPKHARNFDAAEYGLDSSEYVAEGEFDSSEYFANSISLGESYTNNASANKGIEYTNSDNKPKKYKHAASRQLADAPGLNDYAAPAQAKQTSLSGFDSPAKHDLDANEAAARTEQTSVVSPAAKEDSAAPSVARSTALMSIATLGSRATGLVRTWAMAFAIGNSFLTSSYQIANNMPNTIYELVVGGILGAAFIPIFLLQKEQRGEEESNRFACNVLNLFIVVLGILTILAIVFARQVIWTQTFAEGSSEEVISYSVKFFQIFAIQIMFYGLGGVITGMLNANRVYFLPSLAPALNNAIVIISFFVYIPLSYSNPDLSIIVLAVGTSLGVVAQFAIQIPALVKGGFKYSWFIDLHDPALREAVKIAIPTFIYIVGTMVSFSCRNAFSLQAADNGPSTLIYAWTWYQLPHGVVAVSLSRALFTEMSADAAKGDVAALREHVVSGISGTLLLIIPLAFLMGALSTPLMQLFRAGAFSAQDVITVAQVLSLWAISLPFYSVSMFMYNVFASVRKFHVFAIISCALAVVQIAMYAVLCNPASLGLYGVPIADLVYYGAICIISVIASLKHIGSVPLGKILWLALRTVVAGAIGAVVAIAVQSVLPSLGGGIVSGLVQLATCGIIGLVVSFALCVLFRIPEANLVTRIVKRFLPKRV